MSSGTHLCLKWSHKSSWWYIPIILIEIPSRDVCGKMRKQKRPNHRHKQISIPSVFSCYKHHWQILHQFFRLMEMFPISFSLIFIRHPVRKSNPSKESLCLPSSRQFSALPEEVPAISPVSITLCILKAMFPLECFEGCSSAGQAWPDFWGLLQEGQRTCTDQHPLCQMGTTSPTAPATPGVLHHHHCAGRTRWC